VTTKTWDEIVERVAQVLYDPPPPNIYGYSAEHMLAWERAARSKAELQAAAALRALIAEGLAIVPREATEDMQNAAGNVIDHPSVYMGGPSRNGKRRGTQAYEAALSAGEIKPEEQKP